MLSWLFSDPLPIGPTAPDFTAPDDSGRTVTLSSLRGRHVALVFYHGDDTLAAPNNSANSATIGAMPPRATSKSSA